MQSESRILKGLAEEPDTVAYLPAESPQVDSGTFVLADTSNPNSKIALV